MNNTIIIVLFICPLLIGAAMKIRCDRCMKEQAQQKAAETVEAYPWDWTREDERKVHAAMELICDKCHERYMCWEKDRLKKVCEMCPVPDVVYKLVAEGRTTPPELRATSPCTGEVRAVEDAGPYKARREETRR